MLYPQGVKVYIICMYVCVLVAFKHIHIYGMSPVELQCFSEIADISMCLFCSCAIPQRPSQDINSQYLHGASKPVQFIRPCFADTA